MNEWLSGRRRRSTDFRAAQLNPHYSIGAEGSVLVPAGNAKKKPFEDKTQTRDELVTFQSINGHVQQDWLSGSCWGCDWKNNSSLSGIVCYSATNQSSWEPDDDDDNHDRGTGTESLLIKQHFFFFRSPPIQFLRLLFSGCCSFVDGTLGHHRA